MTGVVGIDVARSVPVVSMASGRVIRLCLTGRHRKERAFCFACERRPRHAFSTTASRAAETCRDAIGRSKVLYDKGAIAQKDLRWPRTPKRRRMSPWRPPSNV